MKTERFEGAARQPLLVALVAVLATVGACRAQQPTVGAVSDEVQTVAQGSLVTPTEEGAPAPVVQPLSLAPEAVIVETDPSQLPTHPQSAPLLPEWRGSEGPRRLWSTWGEQRVWGTDQPAPPNADPTVEMAVEWTDANDAPRAGWDTTGFWQEAVLLPNPAGEGTRLLTVAPSGGVVLHGSDGSRAVVGAGVMGPVSVAATGCHVAWMTGEPGMVQLERVDLCGGKREMLPTGDVPQWSPVISPDGQRVAYVASPEGLPGWHVWSAQDGAIRLTNRNLPSPAQEGELPALRPFAAGRAAPVWGSDGVYFSSEDSTLWRLLVP